jgi:inner membrane protein
MDTLTHALSGALVARLVPKATRDTPLSPRAAMLAGAAAAVFPDIDFALRLVDTLTYLNHHQGLTHSLLLWPLWSVLLAWACAWLARRRYSWRAFLPPVAGGLAAHLLGDLVTAYGIQLFAPLSTRRYAGDLVFLFDAAITTLLILGLAAGGRWPARRAVPATTLAVLVLYVGGAAWLQQRAVDLARAGRAPAAQVTALPQPPTPLHWLLIVRDADGYRTARVNLAAGRRAPPPADAALAARYLAAFDPPGQLEWRHVARAGDDRPTQAAWGSPALAPVRRFMRFPAIDDRGPGIGEGCVRFVDLRFTLPEITASFRFGACRAEAREWRLARWRGDFYID